jgi:hypothetical protein
VNTCGSFWFWFMRPFAETLGGIVLSILCIIILYLVFRGGDIKDDWKRRHNYKPVPENNKKPDPPPAPPPKRVIELTPVEIQSGMDRVRWAENLIRQLPPNHEGRNSWLLNYAKRPEPE